MKILIYTKWYYPSQSGGPSNILYWQAQALFKIGHEVTIITTSQGIPKALILNRWQKTFYGKVIYLDVHRWYFLLKYIVVCWSNLKKADVVHINEIFDSGSIILLFLSILINKPIVWSPRGDLSPRLMIYNKNLKAIILQALRKMSKRIVFHSTSLKETSQIHDQFSKYEKIVQLDNMIEIPKLELRTSASTPYLLFVGRIHPVKGIDKLIEALHLSDEFLKSNYILIIAGPEFDKSYSKHLFDMIQKFNLAKKISFVGPVSGDYKQQLYVNSLVTILPSNSENFGNVVIESLAQGTPVIASTNTPWEILNDKKVGSWVSNDPEILKKEIEYYMNMPNILYCEYRKRAVELISEKFDIKKGIKKWECFYSNVMAGKI